jgi:uncharacterized membrane protein
VVAAFAALAAAAGLLGRSLPRGRAAAWCGVAAGALAVYGLSVAIVDAFQVRAAGAPREAVDALAKQAQVALSVAWALVGVALLAAGLTRFGTGARLGGLALLALATVKVFVLDMAALDATYRVLSFIGLGALLLAGSWAYRHLNPPGDDDPPAAPPGPSDPGATDDSGPAAAVGADAAAAPGPVGLAADATPPRTDAERMGPAAPGR